MKSCDGLFWGWLQQEEWGETRWFCHPTSSSSILCIFYSILSFSRQILRIVNLGSRRQRLSYAQFDWAAELHFGLHKSGRFCKLLKSFWPSLGLPVTASAATAAQGLPQD